jgi:hypothetical protein
MLHQRKMAKKYKVTFLSEIFFDATEPPPFFEVLKEM